VEKNSEMLRFVQALVAFRRRQPNVRRGSFLTGRSTKPGLLPDVSWYAPDGRPIDWNATGPSLTSVFGTSGIDNPAARPVMLMLHAGNQPHSFAVPPATAGVRWRLFIDTAAAMPDDIYPEADGPSPESEPILLESHSLRCYVGQ
jgi:glycogen operon protein